MSIDHVIFDKNGKAINSAARHYTNNSDYDWDSIIPIAADWDHQANLQNEVVEAFSKLIEQNKRDYTAK